MLDAGCWPLLLASGIRHLAEDPPKLFPSKREYETNE